MSNPKILGTKTVAQSRLFKIEEVQLEFSNGQKRNYECLRRNNKGAVAILAIDKGDIILIREYGAASNQYFWSLPKGALDREESILEAANRELKEEAGMGARDLRHMHQVIMSPSYSGSPMHFVVAQDCYPERLPGDEPEQMEVIRWPIADYKALLHHEMMVDGASVTAILYWMTMYDRQG